MKKCKRLCVATLVLAFCLGGCGQSKLPQVIDRTTISLSKDGTVRLYLVDSFDKDYYDLEELTDMVIQEAEEYNSAVLTLQGEDSPVTVQEVGKVTGRVNLVSVVYDFDSTAIYEDFCKQFFFYGTVGEAGLQNIQFDRPIYSVKDNTLLDAEQMSAHKEKKVIVTDARNVIYFPGKVTYVSEGAVYNQDGSVDTTATDGLVYIMLK